MSNEENPRLRGTRRSVRVTEREQRIFIATIRKLELPVTARIKGNKSNQGIKASMASYIPFGILIASAFALVNAKDHFKDYTVNKWIFVVALLIFGFVFAITKRIVDNQKRWASRYSKIIDEFQVISGGIVLVSLLSIFFSVPDHFSWLYVVIWFFLALIIARQFFMFPYAWICWGVKKMFCCLQKVPQSIPPSFEDA